ncbi:MAG: hypothetical protein LBD63_01250 [Mycoplasmataceae bacterium]|nr:hypothetical protein [Mycoplasmataceae bacterium]
MVSSYRDADGIPHHKIIKSYGSYQALMAKDHRIIEKLKRQAKEYVADNNQNKKIVIDTAKPSEWHNIYNVGYLFAEAIFFTNRPHFIQEIKKNNLTKFYRYMLYRIIYGNQAEFEYELFYQGPFDKKIKFPSYQILQQFVEQLGIPTASSVLILQRLKVYVGDNSDDRLFYLLINNRGFPFYFHSIDIDSDALQSTLYSHIKLLETKFHTKIFVVQHSSVKPYINSENFYRSYDKHKQNLNFQTKLGIAKEFTKNQIVFIDLAIIGVNKFISNISIQLPANSPNHQLQISAFICAVQIGVFHWFRFMMFREFKVDWLLQDIQQSLKEIQFANLQQNYVNIIVNPNNNTWADFFHLVHQQKDILRMLPSPYFDINKINHKSWIAYIVKNYLKLTNFDV